jgi:hypothetical protein
MTWDENDLTPWFDGRVHKPTRPGVYMLMCGFGKVLGYQRWDGEFWNLWYRTPEMANIVTFRAASQNDNWRGLRKPASWPQRSRT